MKELTRFQKNQKTKFYDKNGTLIEVGDKLDVSIGTEVFYKDRMIIKRDGQLGFLFVHHDFFIPLNTLLDSFFETCEIIKNI